MKRGQAVRQSHLLGTLIALRYRLLWAKARSRNGRIVLLVLSTVTVALAIAVLAFGGGVAEITASRLGRGESLARLLFTIVFVGSIPAGMLLNAGTSEVFSRSSLRRYPITTRTRFAAEQLIGALGPLWIVVAGLALGVAFGSVASGNASPWLAVPAALLFAEICHLTSQLLLRILETSTSRRGGSFIVTLAVIALLILVPTLSGVLETFTSSSARQRLLEVTPPFAAARGVAVAGDFVGLILLAAWATALWMSLARLDQLRIRRPAGAWDTFASPHWNRMSQRLGALVGPERTALATKVLLYYLRSPQTRFNYPLALPLVALTMSSWDRSEQAFLFMLGVAPATAFLATGGLSMNLLGFDGTGFVRYFLVPVPMREVFRTIALVSLLPGVLLILIGSACWFALSPIPLSFVKGAALLSAAIAGLLSLHTLGLWTTVLSPSRIPFDATFGNRLSPAANALLIVAMALFFGLPMTLTRFSEAQVLAFWWVVPLAVVAAALSYAFTLRHGASVLAARREQILDALVLQS